MTPDPRLDHIERRLDAVERDIRSINTWCSCLTGAALGLMVWIIALALTRH